MSKKTTTAADVVRSLPYVVWFCGALGGCFMIIMTMIYLQELNGFAQGLIFVILMVPYVWFIFVGLWGGDDETKGS